MAQLAATGVRLALDDFGTGYSSLNYLRRYPIQVVKIDRSFIEDISVNATSGTLAATIITMAHALGKEVVAEGVETEAQMNFLRERRCDLAQGFYLAHPQSATSITEMLQLQRSRLEPGNEAIRQTG
jgi:EAL domain-containing protein (putative c-di-GMP-specific phosphodiesterase class I)